MTSSYHIEDTIAAIATPPGEGGVAIIRISGREAIAVAKRVFSGPVDRYQSHTAHYGNVCDAFSNVIDSALLLVMHEPRSFTGETCVEIQCHGGSLIARRVLNEVLRGGARPASPGEFTFRAFLNGKLDLTQAEAVQSAIGAKNELALSAATNQLQGRLSERIGSFQARLVEIAAVLEAWVDFPEEGLEFLSFDALLQNLNTIAQEMALLAKTFHHGRVLHNGLSLCLIGSPNVGKSSLMNALLGHERAIVTPIAGTTRDLLQEDLLLNGLHFKLMDTAGIRESDDLVEREGIRRSEEALESADLVLLVMDATRGITAEDRQLLSRVTPHKTVAVWNKIDLAAPADELALSHTVHVSAKERQGLEALKSAIDRIVWMHGPPSKDEVVLTHARHYEALLSAIEATGRLQEGLQSAASPEFLCVEVRDALKALGKIIGQDVQEEILTEIFSRFCLGK